MVRLRSLVSILVVACTGCGSAPAAPSAGSTAVTSLSITGGSQIDLIGVTSSLVAIATRANGTSTDVTTSASWQTSNPSAVTISGAGVATAVGAGSTSVTATFDGVSATLVMRVGAFNDCASYDPTKVQVLSSGGDFAVASPEGAGFILWQGYATESDAAAGLAVFQRYRNFCFVGRNTSRAPRQAYIFGFWLNQFGLSTTIDNEDCEPYDRSTVQVVSRGPAGWSVMASGRDLMLLDTPADATTMAEMVKAYSNQCYIGRGNTRPVPSDYVSRYWK
jgi:hypothetical protein